jgi:hypothetical protein
MPGALQTPSEIPEREAEGVVAEIFLDIRERLGVALVPLVYRQMAVMPSMLEWCWPVLAPLYESGVALEMGQRVLAAVEPAPLQPVTPAMLGALGLNVDAVSAIRNTLASFSRTNPSNLVSLGALRTLLEPGHADPVDMRALPASVPFERERPAQTLLPMLEPEEMTTHTVDLIRQLSAVGLDGVGSLPSVWRILARWPAYLALAKVQLESVHAAGWLEAQMERVRWAADCTWKLTAAEVTPPASALDDVTRERLLEIASAFSGAELIRMVPVVRALQNTLREI